MHSNMVVLDEINNSFVCGEAYYASGYLGQIRVTVVRESRATEFAR